jgi:hypothetical protein
LERGDLSGLNDFHLFSQGRSKKIANILTGTYHHLPVKILDYSYIISSGENSSTKKQTVLIIESSSSALPDFELRPENLLDKIGAALGHNDIDIPSYPQFSKTYLLKGRDETAIRSVFTDGVALYFSQNPGLCVAFNQGQFIFYRAARLVNPIDLSTFLQQGYDIYRLFKA